MALVDVHLNLDNADIPEDVLRFLREADRRIDEFQRDSPVPGFVACDLQYTYRVLRTVAEAQVAPGALFCEWGSGFGVVACLAALLDFDAVGIEIDRRLVNEAQKLADDFELPVEFLHGSFIPHGAAIESDPDNGTGFAWLDHEEAGEGELAFDPDDFDVIFAYPWPDEEDVTTVIFERFAKPGALMVTYHSDNDFRLRRKVTRKTRR